MLIQVSGKGFELSSELRAEVEERMETTLQRFSSRTGRVNVFLADQNGPKNGIDNSLRVIIDLERLPLIVVEEKGDIWHSMLDRSAERGLMQWFGIRCRKVFNSPNDCIQPFYVPFQAT